MHPLSQLFFGPQPRLLPFCSAPERLGRMEHGRKLKYMFPSKVMTDFFCILLVIYLRLLLDSIITVYWFKILRSILLLSTVRISQKNRRSLLSNFIMRCHHRFLYLSLVLSPLLVSLVQAVPPSGAGAHARAAAAPPAPAGNGGSHTRPKDSPESNSNPPKGPNTPTGPKPNRGNMQTSTHGQEEQQEQKEPSGPIDAPQTDNRTPESKPSNEEPPRRKQQEKNPGDGNDSDPTPSAEAQASATPATGRGRNQDSSAAETTATSQTTMAAQTISSSTSAALATSTTPDAAPSSARGTVGLLASQVRLVGLLLGSLIFGVYAC